MILRSCINVFCLWFLSLVFGLSWLREMFVGLGSVFTCCRIDNREQFPTKVPFSPINTMLTEGLKDVFICLLIISFTIGDFSFHLWWKFFYGSDDNLITTPKEKEKGEKTELVYNYMVCCGCCGCCGCCLDALHHVACLSIREMHITFSCDHFHSDILY